jgi:hypothetical protein
MLPTLSYIQLSICFWYDDLRVTSFSDANYNQCPGARDLLKQACEE